jgi:hypothetical protein
MSITWFDVHCTLGRWAEGGPTLADVPALLADLDRLGLQRALVRHTLGGHYDAAYGNALLLEELAGATERLVPCWTALPFVTGELGPREAWLAALRAADVRAVCVYPASHGYPLTPPFADSLLGPLAERCALLLVEVAETTWEHLQTVLAAYPRLRVVVLATGYRVLRPLYALLECHENLYVDTSTLSNFRALEDIAARFGAGRLLFGSGEPRNEGAGTVTALHYAAFSEEERGAVAGGNLARLLREVQL